MSTSEQNRKQLVLVFVVACSGFLFGGLCVAGVTAWLLLRWNPKPQPPRALIQQPLPPTNPTARRPSEVQSKLPKTLALPPKSSRTTTRFPSPNHRKQPTSAPTNAPAVLTPQQGFLSRENIIKNHEIQRLLKSKHSWKMSYLQGSQRSKHYDALLFEPQPNPHTFGVGIRLWKAKGHQEIQARWKRFRNNYPHVQPIPASLGQRAFWAQRKGIRYLVMQAKTPVLLSLTCAQTLCSRQQMQTIARLILLRAQPTKPSN